MNYKNINESLFPKRIKWIDRNGYIRLSNGLVVKIMLTTRETKGIYTGYKVVVLSTKSGVIDGKFFNFKEFLVPTLKDDLGKRIELKKEFNSGDTNIFNITVTSNSVEFYVRTIYEYINLFEN